MDHISSSARISEAIDETALHPLPVGGGSLAAAGVAGVLLGVCLLFTAPDGPPVATATAQQIRDNVITNGTTIKIASSVALIGIAASLVFYAGLARQVRDRLPLSPLADLVLVSGVFVILYQLLDAVAVALTTLLPELIESDLATVDDATLRGWYGFTGYTHFLGDLAVAPIAMAMAAFSLAALRGGLLPKWLSWAGLVFAGAGALGMVGIFSEVAVLYVFWFAALFGYVFWIVAVSVTFLIRLRRTRPAVRS